MKRNDGGPAFPFQSRTSTGELNSPDAGMALRDWFAGQALAGLLANESGPAGDWRKCASDAYEAADAMLTSSSR